MKLRLKSGFMGSLLSLIGAAICLIPSMAHAADLSITKTGPATTVMGSVATFTLSGATNGPLPLPNGVVTTVTDTIPPQFTSIVVISAPTWGCTVVGHLVKCTRNLAIGGNSTYPLITVNAVSNATGNYQNCADISFVPIVTTQPDQNLSNNHNCVNGVITATVAHDVSITKTVVPGPFTVGGYVQFTLHPGNSGPGTLSIGSGDVSITDMIPAGFSFAGWSSPSGWTCPSPAVGTAGPVAIVCNYSGSPVAAGNPMSTINIAIKANVAGSFQNCANITYNHPPGDNWPANNHSCVPFVVGTPPVAHDVDITKTVSGTGPFPVGSSVQFTLHPHNAGPGTLTVGSGDVTVTDTVPAGFTFQGWSGNGWNCPSPTVNTVSPFTITCNYIGATVAGGNILNPINIALKANTAGNYQNCSNITYNHPPGDNWPGNNNSCVPFVVGTLPVPHDVDITKTVGSGPFTVGGNVVFTLHPHNAGPTTLSVGPNDVTVTDTVPAGFTYVSATGTGWLCPTPSPTVGPFTITCTYPSGPVVNAGNPMNAITVTLKATATGTMQNCTDIAYNHAPGDAWMFNNHACVNATVTPPAGADLSATKSCVVNGPQSVLCTVTVTNNGTTATQSPLHIADIVSGAPSNAVITGAGGTLPIGCSPGAGPITPISCTANTSLAPNQSGTALFSFKLPTGGTMTNCATVTTPQTDPTPANNTNICSTVIVPPPTGPPDVSVTKLCVVNGPQSVLCTVTVTNNGTTATQSPMHIADIVSGAPSNAVITGAGGTLPIGCSPGAGPITPISCTANTSLAPSQSGTALFSFKLPTGGTMTNCATVTTPQTDPTPANNTNICSTVIVPPPTGPPDLSVTKLCVVNGPQSVLCTVTVTNNGTTATQSPLHIADIVSGAPSNAVITGAGGTLPIGCSPGAGPITPISCTANTSLAPNQSGTALFSFKLPTGGTMTNCATVTTPQTDPTPANNTNICSTVIVPPPQASTMNFQIQKQFQGPAVPGTYTFHISCTGAYTGPGTINLVVPPNPSATSIVVPVGSTCTLTENPVSGWQTPLFGGSSQPINPNLNWGATIGPFQPTNTVADRVLVINRP